MKIYIASASAMPHLELVEGYMRGVERAGHTITYDWTRAVRRAGSGSPDDSNTRLEGVLNDLAGVRDADLVWLIAPPIESRSTGAWVELGYALACAVPVITSGDARRCIFADIAIKRFTEHLDALVWIESLR